MIVVLNGCRDNTEEVVKRYRDQNTKILRYFSITTASKGKAVREGFKKAQGEVIGFIDADGATEPFEFDKCLQALQRADGAIASRWKKGSVVINRNIFRKLVSYGFRMVVKTLFNLPFYDTQCGAKVFKHEVIRTIVQKLQIDNMAFDVELLYLARCHGYRIEEVPTVWIDKGSSATLGTPLNVIIKSIKIFFTLFKIRFRKG